jgi:hypothetical protein
MQAPFDPRVHRVTQDQQQQQNDQQPAPQNAGVRQRPDVAPDNLDILRRLISNPQR